MKKLMNLVLTLSLGMMMGCGSGNSGSAQATAAPAPTEAPASAAPAATEAPAAETGTEIDPQSVDGELVIYTSMYPFAIEMMDEAIKKKFPNLVPGNDGSFFYYSGTSALITKIYGEMGENHDQPLDADMFMVAEPAFSLELKDYGYLHPFEIQNPDQLLRFDYDKDGYWYPIRVLNMVLAYNPEMEQSWADKGVTIPKTFKDFAYDPSLKGYISMSDPTTSGSAYATVVSLLDKYGEEYLDKLNENKVMRESGSTAIAKLQSGECAAIMILEESILKELDDGQKKGTEVTNLKVIYPDDGVVLVPSTVMIVAEEYSKNVNTEAAEAIAQWMLTEEAQDIIMQAYMHSVLKNQTRFPANSIDTNELIRKDLGVDWEKAYHQREEINKLWTEKITQ
ncbi:MAG: extracellular solute-binding protein [Solobacterium sp.]|nr:extracellular solute-binding protein [Solobacterium sp.]MBR2793174.1 extracellular solute-binding protein [Solobacterium sp.]